MARERSILHVDMDAFFASIEQMDDPSLRGRPVLVGHDGARGVVAAASYEARRWGCHSALPMAIAKRRCPEAVVVPVRFERYRELSTRLFDLLDEFSPLVEPLSVDEAFLELTGSDRLLGPPQGVARKLKDQIKERLGLTASVGLAPNKFLAKLASDLEKPDGLTVIRSEDIDRVLPPLPVTRLWGVGPVAAARLEVIGVKTIGDLRRAPLRQLRGHFGADTEHLLRLAHGLDDRPVVCDHAAKSIGHEQTFGSDLNEPQVVRAVLLEQVEAVARRLRKQGLHARCVTLKIRYRDFETISRSHTLASATNITRELWQVAREIFDRLASSTFQPVRLIEMSASSLGSTQGQLDLYEAAAARDKQRRLDEAADRVVARFGQAALTRGGATGTGKLGSSLRRPDDD